jgi:cobyrinic acid a,c-diamide synthase
VLATCRSLRAVNGIAVAALGTGEGKTLVGLGLARALQRSGYTVAPIKSGPDYIDARLYEAACGVRARNVDLWLDGPARVAEAFARERERGAAVVLEGMMGLFDGDDEGQSSTAHLCALAELPVVLVVDGWRMSQSAAAAALGAAAMTPRVRIAGVVLNRCGGEAHARAVRAACEAHGVRLLATLPFDAAWSLPERALGLDVRAMHPQSAMLDAVADALLAQLDLREWFGVSAPVAPQRDEPANGPVIAYADDDALWFTYPQTLDALRAAGAHPVPFSPLHDTALPPRTAALWLGGGYPETHAAALSANEAMRAAVADAANAGVPIYAECGGLMYLLDAIETREGTYRMAGVLRGRSSIAQPRLTIGYRMLRATRDSLFDRAGDEVRGYEFHYASAAVEEARAYEGAGDGGAWRERLLAGFVHRRFFPGDAASCRFVESLSS